VGTNWFSQASDEEIYYVLDAFLEEVKKQFQEGGAAVTGGGRAKTTKPVGPVQRLIERLKDEGWLAEHGWPENNLRERIYPLLWKGIERGFVFIKPPRGQQWERRIHELYGVPQERIRVVAVRGKKALEHVTRAGAQLLLELINEVRKRKPVGEPTHLAWGAGNTSRLVAKRLSELLEKEEIYPPLTLHALTSGFLVDEPMTAPMTSHGFFDAERFPIHSIGLFSEAVVKCKDYKDVKKAFGVKRSFQLAGQIEIIVSSLASREDDHSLFIRFLRDYQQEDPADYAKLLRYLDEQGWCGDAQYLPFSADGPIPMDRYGIRAVTLFELPDLVERARAGGNRLVLLSAPCGECGRTRTKALIPLIENPALRVWTHLVLDAQTAEELIEYKEKSLAE
jgi:hypothetical protein